MMRSTMLLLPLAAACATSGSLVDSQNERISAPKTMKKAVTDSYHGAEVVDEYRWLEDWNDPEVKAWTEAQSAHARKHLDAIADRPAVAEDVRRVLAAEIAVHYDVEAGAGGVFAMRKQPPKPQPALIWMPSVDQPQEAKVFVDPVALDPSGETTIDWYRPSPDGKWVAVSLSKAGSESGDVTLFEVSTGQPGAEKLTRVHGGTAGGDLAWAPDSKGFWYTRYPREGARPAEEMMFFVELWWHQLGTPVESDRFELGKDFPKIAEYQLEVTASGLLLAAVQNGDGGEFQHYLRAKDGKWTQLTRYEDRIVQATFGAKDELYLLSRLDAPRGKLLRLPAGTTELAKAELVIPEGADTMVDQFWATPIRATAGAIHVTYQLGGPSTVRSFDLAGKPVASPPVPEVSAVIALSVLADGRLLIGTTSFLAPLTWSAWDPSSAKWAPTPLSSASPVDLSGFEVVRELATSKDGTKVPVNIIRPKGINLDGSHAAVVTGYGGYGLSIQPGFQARAWPLLKRGVVYAVANLRGGGEFGEEWHRQGNLTKKQNVFDDFEAVLRLLIEQKYTSPARLGITGGSNGGLLMGALMTQHPDLVRAVVSFVGIYDMLRVELSPNGSFNITEFGTVKDKAQFEALHAYSPYHHVNDGTVYPATLMITGANDPRVDPMQSRKMIARLQEAVAGGAPMLLRTDLNAGHGMGSSLETQISQYTDAYAFMLHELGVASKP